jgi:ankyrin repeat protein
MSVEFFSAIREGDQDKVQRFLLDDPDLLGARDPDGLSPILVAAYQHQPAMALFLAERQVVLTIFEAAATGKTDRILRLLAKDLELVNAYTGDGFQPLGLAAYFGQEAAARILIEAGAEVHAPARNTLGVTPLQSAVAGRNAAITRLLLNAGVDPNVRERGGYTPLHVAAHNGDVEILRSLLVAGADLDAQNDDGKTPPDMAEAAGHQEAVRLLREWSTQAG